MRDLTQIEQTYGSMNSTWSRSSDGKSAESFDEYEFLSGMGTLAVTYNWSL